MEFSIPVEAFCQYDDGNLKRGAKFASTTICRNTLSTARELVTSLIWQFPQICNLKWKGGNPKQKGPPLLFNIQYRQLQRLERCTWALNDFRAEIFGRKKRNMKTMNASQRPPLLSSYSRCDLKENIITFFSISEKDYIAWASLKLCHLR